MLAIRVRARVRVKVRVTVRVRARACWPQAPSSDHLALKSLE